MLAGRQVSHNTDAPSGTDRQLEVDHRTLKFDYRAESTLTRGHRESHAQRGESRYAYGHASLLQASSMLGNKHREPCVLYSVYLCFTESNGCLHLKILALPAFGGCREINED